MKEICLYRDLSHHGRLFGHCATCHCAQCHNVQRAVALVVWNFLIPYSLPLRNDLYV